MSAAEVAVSDDERGRARTKRPRSAVTSGRQLFIAGDPNSAWSRRFYDLIAAHVSDLGGPGALSEAQAGLIRRAAAIEVELEHMESRLSRGEEVDLDKFARVSSQLRRLFETIGLERAARDVTPTVAEITAEYAARKAADAVSAPAAADPSPAVAERMGEPLWGDT